MRILYLVLDTIAMIVRWPGAVDDARCGVGSEPGRHRLRDSMMYS